MSLLNAADLAYVKATQELSLHDGCTFYTHAGSSSGSSGVPLDTWASAGSSICGFNPTASREIINANTMVTTQTNGELRLPIATSFSTSDRVAIHLRYGTTPDGGSANLMFGIAGEPRRGASGVLVDLIRMKPGANP
jgi:hypothetical protein